MLMINNNISATPLVSVLVATYNQSGVVEETLQSIAKQSYKNIEIIISDDCSADGTQDILTRFAKNHPEVILFLQPKNLGITANYNFLAEKSRGKYVAIFSGDDVMLPEKIERQVNVLQSDDKSSFCHHAVTVLDYHSNVAGKVITRKYENNITSIHDVLRGFGIPGSMSVMYRKSMVENPVWDSSIRVASDWLQIIKLTMAGRGLYLDESLCFYRQDGAYNGKDPSTYETDFIRTIEIAELMFSTPGDSINKSCRFAKSRYQLGAAFRCLMRNDAVGCRLLLTYPMTTIKFFLPSVFVGLLSYLRLPTKILKKCKAAVRSFI